MMKAQEKASLNNTLSKQEQGLVNISALTATGNLEALQIQIGLALDAGLTINEIKEAMVQLYAYCGFPRSLNALGTLEKLLTERKLGGKQDQSGQSISMDKPGGDHYERGRKTLEELTGVKQLKPAPGFGEFTPRIDAFLKEHLFADIFDSKVLSYQQRELITISALAALPGVEGQLNAHVNMGKNTGISFEQLIQVSQLIEKSVNRTQANTLRKLLSLPELPLPNQSLMVRISEIEIFTEYQKAYEEILKEEAATSVNVEPGVIAIYPMFQKEHPAQIRIIEMYADSAAYQSHLKTPHFQHYKTATQKMVKSLKLVDMQSIDPQIITAIFSKFK
ncbi:carboxymuconolactone decarboxylase family protein [Pedobacter aquatilis]|uniref:carboxymuconolactone decarboxylase family protein n=1 Tax=Pedobacter aquatilis TaxID=351343 RepID=UPI00292EEBF9|nr:carboxymuconolactone decarboxylase family protein [Pedobacter aquatilis]